jgi:predicted methyltransferase
MPMEPIVERVAERTGLPLNTRTVERVLRALLAHHDFWEIVDAADEVVPIVAETIRVLDEQGWLRVEPHGIFLRESARETLEREWGLRPLPDFRCLACEGRGLDPRRLPSEGIETFMTIQAERPRAIIDYDQGYITPESTLARFAFAFMRGDIQGRRILVLGDDDLVSVAVCLMGEPREVVVVEIDRRLVEFLQYWADRMGWPLTVYSLDLSQPLPASFLRAFDTFLTDPPESMAAFRAFVGRGLAALRGPGSAGYFGLTRREASLFKWHQVQRYLIEQGAVLTDVVQNFHAYVNWDYAPKTRAWRLAPVKSLPDKPWYRSSLCRVELLTEAVGEVDTVFDVHTFNDAEASTT